MDPTKVQTYVLLVIIDTVLVYFNRVSSLMYLLYSRRMRKIDAACSMLHFLIDATRDR